jgi:hypothetical protein
MHGLSRNWKEILGGIMSKSEKLSREEVVSIASEKVDLYGAAQKLAERLAQALILAWDAMEGLDKFDDNNRIEPYCVVCKLATSRGHEPDCKLAKALPEQSICDRCEGCGFIADSEDGEPWTAWDNLPEESQRLQTEGEINVNHIENNINFSLAYIYVDDSCCLRSN